MRSTCGQAAARSRNVFFLRRATSPGRPRNNWPSTQAPIARSQGIRSASVLPLEFRLLKLRPEPWTPTDSILIAKLLALALSLNWDSELQRFRLLQRVGPEIAARLEITYPDENPNILERLSAGRGLEHMIAPLAERAGGKAPHRILVFDEKDGVLAGHVARSSALRLVMNLRRFDRGMAREIKLELRPLAKFALKIDEPARLLHDAVDRRQTKARSLPHGLGGVERFENLDVIFFRDSLPCVDDFDQDVIAPGNLAIADRLCSGERQIRRGTA